MQRQVLGVYLALRRQNGRHRHRALVAQSPGFGPPCTHPAFQAQCRGSDPPVRISEIPRVQLQIEHIQRYGALRYRVAQSHCCAIDLQGSQPHGPGKTRSLWSVRVGPRHPRVRHAPLFKHPFPRASARQQQARPLQRNPLYRYGALRPAYPGIARFQPAPRGQ